MKEQIETIPVNEAFESGDECPFCWLERQAEQRAIRYVVGPGASYMEPNIRMLTDRKGFCGAHMKKMYDYGNSLGNALILQTYYLGLMKELEAQLDDFELPPKKPFLRKTETADSPLLTWAKGKQDGCFLCEKSVESMHRYFLTFFFLLKEEEFREKVATCKGFCMRHFAQLLEEAKEGLPNAHREWFYKTVLPLMRKNLSRVQADLNWFVQKFDYRNATADWKNSRDAVSRSMQKIRGIYPADPPYKEK